MSLKLYLFFVSSTVILGVASADIFGELFKWDIIGALSGGEDEEESLKREEEDTSFQSSCDCKGMKCNCCIDFNMSTIIDLGGPGCVNMEYISKDVGVLLNVSYGESVLHSQTVTNKNKKGTCMTLLPYFAEICAGFENLKEEGDGMVGCLNFEPTVFGEVTSYYPVGCFRMNSSGMFVNTILENSTANSNEKNDNEITTKNPKEDEGDQSFIEAVNQSAQESLEFFSRFLGFNTEEKKTDNNSTLETENSSNKRNLKQIEILEPKYLKT